MSSRLVLLLVWVTACVPAHAYFGDLESAYAALGFDPKGPGSSVVVLLSDVHLNVDPRSGLCPDWTTNLNADLVRVVNEMDPPPARILIAGDLTSSLCTVPGSIPTSDWRRAYATNEMGYWRPAIRAFTNVAETNILWVPGNHDQEPFETNAEIFCALLEAPPHQAFDLGGLHWVMLNGGNYAHPSAPEREWAAQQIAATSPTQTLAVIAHQPPFNGTASERGTGLFLRDCLQDWPDRWYLFSGHAHYQGLETVEVGKNGVAAYVNGPASTNVFNGWTRHAGFRLICLKDGIAGTIYYHLQSRYFQPEPPPDWDHRRSYIGPFEGVDGLLWCRVKVYTNFPEVVEVQARDSLEWFAYTTRLEVTLPLQNHSNQATHFTILSAGLDPASTVEFSVDRTNWTSSDPPVYANQVYTYALPAKLGLSATAYARFQSPPGADNFIAGWGLSTTNPPPHLRYPQLAALGTVDAVAGQEMVLTNLAINPYSPPDVQEFRLLSAPEGAEIEPRTGVLRWRPPVEGGSRLVPFRVAVANEGPPLMSATQEFWVNVSRPTIPLMDHAGWQNGAFEFLVTGETGKHYTVWASSNLVDWTAVWATNPTTMPFRFAAPVAASQPSCFYRMTSVVP